MPSGSLNRSSVYTLTRAGRQIMQIMSPETLRIFGEVSKFSLEGTPRTKLDISKRFAQTLSTFRDLQSGVSWVRESVSTLVDQSKMDAEVTERTKNGQPVLVVQLKRADDGIVTAHYGPCKSRRTSPAESEFTILLLDAFRLHYKT